MPVLTNGFTPPFVTPPAPSTTAADLRQVLTELAQLKAMVQRLTDGLIQQQRSAELEKVQQKAAMTKAVADAGVAGAKAAQAAAQQSAGPEAMFKKAMGRASGG